MPSFVEGIWVSSGQVSDDQFCFDKVRDDLRVVVAFLVSPTCAFSLVAGHVHRNDRIFLRRELYIKGVFWQALAERRLEDWRRMSPRAMAARVLGRGRATPNWLLVD
jgi:hypothetical protein